VLPNIDGSKYCFDAYLDDLKLASGIAESCPFFSRDELQKLHKKDVAIAVRRLLIDLCAGTHLEYEYEQLSADELTKFVGMYDANLHANHYELMKIYCVGNATSILLELIPVRLHRLTLLKRSY
jgi:hypothetical protein